MGLYYLESRYYDPRIRRFISPDNIDYLEPTSFNGLNLYAYCGNDPVNYYDPTGHFALFVITAIIGAIAGFGLAAYKDYKEDGILFNGNIENYISYILGGAIIGGLIGFGLSYALPALSTFASTSFTIGGGLSISGGAGILSAGFTITGAQILKGAGFLLGLGIMMYKIPMHGTPNTSIKNGGSFGEYDSNGNLIYRVDTTGKAHFIKAIQEYCLPHIHKFTWKLVDGIWRFIEEVLPYTL